MKRLSIAIIAVLAFVMVVRALSPLYDEKKSAWGLIGLDGKYEISPQFAAINRVADGGYIVDKKGKKGYVNSEGKLIVKPKYDSIIYTPHDYLIFLKDNKWGTTGKNGKEILKPKYDSMTLTELNHLCITEKGAASLINPDGSYVISPDKGYLKLSPLGQDLLTTIDNRGKGLINEQGATIVSSGLYDSFEIGDNDIIYCRKGNRKGIVSLSGGTTHTSALYDVISPFSAEYLSVTDGGLKGLIDLTGREILPTRYESISPATHPTLGQFYILTSKGKKGWTNLTTVAVEPAYNDVRLKPGEYGQVMVCKDGLWSPADIKGNDAFNLIIPAGNNLRIVGHKENADTIQEALVDADFNIIRKCDPRKIVDVDSTEISLVTQPLTPIGKLIIATNWDDMDLLGPDGKPLIVKHILSDYHYFPDEKALALLDYGVMDDEEEEADSTVKVQMPSVRIFSDSGKELLNLPYGDVLDQTKAPFTELPENVRRILTEYSPAYEMDDEPEEDEEVAVVEEVITYPIASIEKVWVTHNVWQNKQKGMRIHVKFRIWNCLGQNGQCVAWFSFNNGTRLVNYDNSYGSTDGQVSTSAKFTPGYENCIYNDLTMFIPISQLHLKSGVKHNCMFTVGIFSDGERLASSEPVYFTVTPSTPKKPLSKMKGIRIR